MFRFALLVRLPPQLGLLVFVLLSAFACAPPQEGPHRLPGAKAFVDPLPTADVDFEVPRECEGQDADCQRAECRGFGSCPTAPPFDDTLVSTVWEATRFLFEGSPPRQVDADEAALDKQRITLLHGTVFDTDGSPLPGVRISCLQHPELGYTFSDQAGRYDLALNGGGEIILDFTAPGYLRAQRRVATQTLRYASAPDVGLLRPSERSNVLTSGEGCWLQGDKLNGPLGKHQAFMVVEPGTEATLVKKDGKRKKLGRYHLRLTVYPARGLFGGRREPGSATPVEPASPASENELAYTYAVSVDEAENDETAHVEFSHPLKFYLTNYLGLAPGGNPFVRAYDYDAGQWTDAGAGQLLRIIGLSDGIAAIDINRDGAKEVGERAIAIDFSENEALELGARLKLIDTAYRSRIQTTGTFSASFLTLMEPPYVPNELPADLRPEFAEPSRRNDVQVETLATHHDFAVVGAPFQLVYHSDRTSGYQPAYRVTVPVLRDHLPLGLTTIHPILDIAGQRLRPLEPLTVKDHDYTFEWDGRDAQGRLLQGRTQGTVWIGYGFLGELSTTQFEDLFLQPSNVDVAIEAVAWRRQDVWLGALTSANQQLGGLAVDVYHHYDPEKSILYRGDGTFREYNGAQSWVTSQPVWPVGDLVVESPLQVANAPDGRLFLGANLQPKPDPTEMRDPDEEVEVPRRMAVLERKLDGSVSVILGEDATTPDAKVTLGEVTALAVSPDNGVLYVLDAPKKKIYSINREGAVTQEIGNNDEAGIKHRFATPRALAVGPSGQLYIADGDLVVVAFGGRITLFAGAGGNAEGQSTQSLALDHVSGLAIEPTTGDIYVSSAGNNAVYQMSASGRVERLAGVGRADSYGDGDVAQNAALSAPGALAIARDGSLLIADTGNRRIRRIYADGTIETWLGGGDAEEPPVAVVSGTDIGVAQSLSVAPDGQLLVVSELSDDAPKTLFDVSASPPTLREDTGEVRYLIPDSDGSELFEFDAQGRHLRTRDALTTKTLLDFSHDSGLLVEVADANGQKTTIERPLAPSGDVLFGPPFAEPTHLRVKDGFAQGIVDAANEETKIEMASSGQLTQIHLPTDDTISYEYDDAGLVHRARYPGGYEETFSLDAARNQHVVSITSNNAESTLTVEVRKRGLRGAASLTDPDGAVTSGAESLDGSFNRVFASGAKIEGRTSPVFTWFPYARFPASTKLVTASGTRSLTVAIGRRATANVEVRTQRIQISAANSEEEAKSALGMSAASFEREGRGAVVTELGGRPSSVVFDVDWLPREIATGDLWTTAFEYNDTNQLTELKQTCSTSEREVEFTIGKNGLTSEKRNSLGKTTAWGYDLRGQSTSVSYGDEHDVSWKWDSLGRLQTLNLPSEDPLTLVYRDGQLLGGPATQADVAVLVNGWQSSSQGPSVETYNYADGQLSSVRLPDRRTLGIENTPGGRVSQVSTKSRKTRFVYARGGTLISADTPEVTTSFVYDSPLLVSVFLGGALTSTIDIEHDDTFRQSSVSYGTSTPVAFEYDADSNLTSAGPVVIERDVASKRITGWSVGDVTTSYEYDAFGEPSAVHTRLDSTPIFSQDATRNAAGKIVTLTETSAAAATTESDETTDTTLSYLFDYDKRDQLSSVTTPNSALLFTYDARGNRSASSIGQSDVLVDATYSGDRLTEANGWSFSYSASGDLLSKSKADGTTVTYTADEFGNILRVEGATDVKYRVDAFGRRVTRYVNQVQKQTWIYHQHVNPIAELDPLGVVTRFIYASRKSVPDAMLKDEQTYAIVSDLQGSVRRVINESSGEVVQELDYDVLGRVTRDTNPGFQPFGFGGGLYDPETQLLHFGTRDYDPELGRFLMRTSIGDRPQLNAYVFAANDPVSTSMPDGHWVLPHRETFAQRFVGTALLDAITEATSRWSGSSAHANIANAADASRYGIQAAIELGLGRTLGASKARPAPSVDFAFASDFLTGLELALSTVGPYVTRFDLAPQTLPTLGQVGRYFGRCSLPESSAPFSDLGSLPERDSIAMEPWLNRARGAVCR